MTRTVNSDTVALVKQWEGIRLTAYPDPGSRNGEPYTIGYGHTSDGHLKVHPGLTITQAQADDALTFDLAEAAAIVESAVKVPLTDNQFGALVSFAFNVGMGNPKDKKSPIGFLTSTLLRKLNVGDYNAVPVELAKWVNNDGKRMTGLVNRRAAEAGLWARGSFVSSRGVQAEPAAVPVTKEAGLAAGGAIASIVALTQTHQNLVLVAAIAIAFAAAAVIYFKRKADQK